MCKCTEFTKLHELRLEYTKVRMHKSAALNNQMYRISKCTVGKFQKVKNVLNVQMYRMYKSTRVQIVIYKGQNAEDL